MKMVQQKEVSQKSIETPRHYCVFFKKKESMTLIIARTKLIEKTKAEPEAAASCVLVVMSLRRCCCFAENNDTITAIPIAPETC